MTQNFIFLMFHEITVLCSVSWVMLLLSVSPPCSLFSLHLTSSCSLHWKTLGQQDRRGNGVQKNRLYLTCFPKARSLWKYYAHWTWMPCEQSGYFDSVHMCLLVVAMFFISLRSGRVFFFFFSVHSVQRLQAYFLDSFQEETGCFLLPSPETLQPPLHLLFVSWALPTLLKRPFPIHVFIISNTVKRPWWAANHIFFSCLPNIS